MDHLKFIKHIILLATFTMWLPAQAFSIARIHYGGGGDWYGDPSSLSNLLEYISEHTTILVEPNEYRIKLTDPELFSHSYLYLTGHGNIRFTEDGVGYLRDYLLKGGFLHADDNYGMDASFRREMKRVFPDKEWVALPFDHKIFHAFYDYFLYLDFVPGLWIGGFLTLIIAIVYAKNAIIEHLDSSPFKK